MAIAFRAAATAGNSSGGNLTINKPTGTVDNDIMVVVLYSEHSSTAWTLPSGWAWWGGATGRANSDANAWVYLAWKRASSEGASYTFTHGGTAWRIGCIASFSGALISGDPEDSTGPTGNSGTGSANVLASITTNTANCMLVGGAANFAGENLGVASSGMSLAGQLGGCGIVYQIQAAAGASGTKTLSDTFDAGSWATWHVAIKEATSGQTAPVNQLSETDTLQAIARTKQKEIGQQSETDSLQPIARQKTIVLGLLSETGTIQSVTQTKQKEIGLQSEIDSLQIFTRQKTLTLSVLNENQELQSIAGTKQKTLGQLESTESLLNFSMPVVYTLGLLIETNELQEIARQKTVELQQLNETDSLLGIDRAKTTELSILSTDETLQSFATQKIKSLGLLSETDSLFAISIPGEIVYVLGLLEESNSLLSIARVKQGAIGLLSESNELFIVARVKQKAINQLVETSLLFPIAGGEAIGAHYIYVVPAESRIYVIPSETIETLADRTFVIPVESRSYKVTHD